MKDVDPKLLRSFAAVLEHGSVTSAAAALGYVPSAVSQHIARLEFQLGVSLVHRSRAGVVATDQGRELQEPAAAVLAALSDFSAQADRVAGRQESLRIGVFASAAAELLAPALVGVREQHPDVAVGLQQCEPPDGLRALSMGRIDVLLAHHYNEGAFQADSTLLVELVGIEPLLLCSAAGAAAPCDLAQAARCGWVAGTAGTPDRRLVAGLHARHGLAPAIVAETDDYNVALNYIAAGLAVGLLPASLVASSRPRLRVVGLPETPGRQVLMLRRPGRSSPLVPSLLSALRGVLLERLRLAEQV